MKTILDKDWREEALSRVAKAMVETGDLAGALAAAEGLAREDSRAEALSRVAKAMAEMGNLAGALAVAEGIADEDSRAEMLSGVARTMVEAGDEPHLTTWTQDAFAHACQHGRDEVWNYISAFAPVLGKLGVITPTWQRIQAVEAVLTG